MRYRKRFWDLMAREGLAPRRLDPAEVLLWQLIGYFVSAAGGFVVGWMLFEWTP
jgi:hypothetical protein